MIKLNWKVKTKPELNEIEKKVVLHRLNKKAELHPEGFDIEFPNGLEAQIMKFIIEELDVYYTGVGQGLETFCIAVYQNHSDMFNRESSR